MFLAVQPSIVLICFECSRFALPATWSLSAGEDYSLHSHCSCGGTQTQTETADGDRRWRGPPVYAQCYWSLPHFLMVAAHSRGLLVSCRFSPFKDLSVEYYKEEKMTFYYYK